ncbi:MAG: hypothetical protein ACK5LK_03090 [Chthoniobacterales bacterium]
MKKTYLLTACLSFTLLAAVHAGESAKSFKEPVVAEEPAPDPFARAIRPISNPTAFDLPIARTQLHAIYIHQNLPRHINSTVGKLPLGGNFNLYALQFEYAFTKRFSLVATKDGYIDFNPHNTLNKEDGFANLAAGLKYAFIYLPEHQFALSGTTTVEVPTGSSRVFQGKGNGAINPSLSALKMFDRLQLASSLGMQIPFGQKQSTTGFVSAHASYEVVSWFIPLVELNWYHVFNAGDGSANYKRQLGNTVPAVVKFEGSDLINLGAANSKTNDIVTMAFGFRSKITKNLQAGFAFEIPLTKQSNSLMQNRFTIDMIWMF